MAEKRTTGASTGHIAHKKGNTRKNGSKKKVDPALESRRKIVSVTVKIALVLLAVLLLIAWWSNRVDWSCTNIVQCSKDTPLMIGGGKGFPISVSGSRALDIKPLANGFGVLTDTSYSIHNTESKTVDIRAHYMSSPALTSSGRYALIYDIGGKSYRLETVAETLDSGKTDYVITGGCVSRTGRYALTSYNSSKLSMMEVRESSGEIIHKWHSDYFYITSVALSADGQYIAVCGLNAQDGKPVSTVIIQKVGEKADVSRLTFTDVEFITIEFTKPGTLIAVGSTKTLIIDAGGTSHSEISYGGSQLISYDISYDSGILLYISESADLSLGTLVSCDTMGYERFKINVTGYVLAISAGQQHSSVLTREKAYIYSDIGTLISENEVGESCFDIITLGNGAFVASTYQIDKID